jgi:carbonic anhydrase
LYTAKSKVDPLETILRNNKQWVEKTNAADPDFFKQAGSVHKPKYLYFGCSDARVPANLILGLG